ncbi:unnamed protein product [Phaeothamnion confervicola]
MQLNRAQSFTYTAFACRFYDDKQTKPVGGRKNVTRAMISFVVGSLCPDHPDNGRCPCRTLTTYASLFTAAELGDAARVAECVRRRRNGANALEHGYTALHLAAQHNRTNVVKTLLALGARVDGFPAVSGSGGGGGGGGGVCGYVSGSGCGATPLHRACYSGATEAVRLLLAAGANVQAVDTSFHDGRMPLHKACAGGPHVAIIDALLAAGADPAARDAAGRTPLDLLLFPVAGEGRMASASAAGDAIPSNGKRDGGRSDRVEDEAVCSGSDGECMRRTAVELFRQHRALHGSREGELHEELRGHGRGPGRHSAHHGSSKDICSGGSDGSSDAPTGDGTARSCSGDDASVSTKQDPAATATAPGTVPVVTSSAVAAAGAPSGASPHQPSTQSRAAPLPPPPPVLCRSCRYPGVVFSRAPCCRGLVCRGCARGLLAPGAACLGCSAAQQQEASRQNGSGADGIPLPDGDERKHKKET